MYYILVLISSDIPFEILQVTARYQIVRQSSVHVVMENGISNTYLSNNRFFLLYKSQKFFKARSHQATLAIVVTYHREKKLFTETVVW